MMLTIIAGILAAQATAQLSPDEFRHKHDRLNNLRARLLRGQCFAPPAAHKPAGVGERVKYISYGRYRLSGGMLDQDSTVLVYRGNNGSEFDYVALTYWTEAPPTVIGITTRTAFDMEYPRVTFDSAYIFSMLPFSTVDTNYIRYSPEGNAIERKESNYLYYRTYNMQQQCVSETSYDIAAGDSLLKQVYAYNGNDQLIAWTTSIWQNGMWEYAFKDEYQYGAPGDPLPSYALSYQWSAGTWMMTDSIAIVTAPNGKVQTLTVYEIMSGQGILFYDSLAYDGDQRVYYLGMSTPSFGGPSGQQMDTMTYETRILNSRKLPVSVFVKYKLFPGTGLDTWDTVTCSVTYNANDKPVTVISEETYDAERTVSKYYYETYSGAGVGNTAEGSLPVTIYPNPAADMLHIAAGMLKPGKAHVEIINALGQSVYRATVPCSGGAAALDVAVGGMRKGVYRVSVTDASGSRFYGGFIKQ